MISLTASSPALTFIPRLYWLMNHLTKHGLLYLTTHLPPYMYMYMYMYVCSASLWVDKLVMI